MTGEGATSPAAARAADVHYWLAFAACALAAVAPLWSVIYLPMTDLPQHAAQIAIWKHLEDPAFGFRERFEIDWFTPYLVGYTIARIFASVTTIAIALKLVVTLAVVALPLSIHALLRSVSGDRWWALAGFPLAFGFSFYWGFLNYIVAVPLGILLIAGAFSYAQRPTLRSGVALGAFTCFLFFAHSIVLGVSGLSAALVIALESPGARACVRRILPLVAPLPLIGAWVAITYGREAQVRGPIDWDVGLYRVVELPGTILGFPRGAPDAVLFSALLVLALAATGVRPRRIGSRWAPLGVALLLYLFFPADVFGTILVFPRFAVFLIPFALIALEPGRPWLRPRVSRLLLPSLVVAWMVGVTVRHQGFSAEARGFDAVVRRMEPNRRVYPLIFERESRYVPATFPFVHFVAWSQATKGGIQAGSFAGVHSAFARYRADQRVGNRANQPWTPHEFDLARDGRGYDYFVVRAPVNLGPALFGGAEEPFVLEAHEGDWWLYRAPITTGAPEPLPGAAP